MPQGGKSLGGGLMTKRVALLSLALLLLFAAPAQAVTFANLEPESQSHAHGVSSNWTGTWSGGPCLWAVYLGYGDGFSTSTNTCLTSKSYSHTFWPCQNTNFTQTFRVTDQNGDRKIDNTTAFENGGTPC